MKTHTIEEAKAILKPLFFPNDSSEWSCDLQVYQLPLVTYQKGHDNIQNKLMLNGEGKLISAYGGEMINAAILEAESLVIVTFDDASTEIDRIDKKRLCTPWIEIDEERYEEMRDVLPPEKWQGGFFRLMEYTTGRLTMHFANVGSRYFEATREAIADYAPYREEIRKQFNI